MTEFVSLEFLVYQVGTCWIEHNNLRLKKSAISKRESLWVKWKR